MYQNELIMRTAISLNPTSVHQIPKSPETTLHRSAVSFKAGETIDRLSVISPANDEATTQK